MSLKIPGKLTGYILLGIVFTMLIALFSVVMSTVSSYRSGVFYDNYMNIGEVYNGPLTQQAPALEKTYLITQGEERKLSTDNVVRIVSTDAEVKIVADFVKVGLSYQPTYKTTFLADYVVMNTSDRKVETTFSFPLPVNPSADEVSNVILLVDGVDYPIKKSETIDAYYGYVNNKIEWKGEMDAGTEREIRISYNTVGLSMFEYSGWMDSVDAQDFALEVTIEGTRSYNVNYGLSVDEREFSDNGVKLTWDKEKLFSAPVVSVNVGGKMDPAAQVSRVYLTMTPIYVVFIAALLFLANKAKKAMSYVDMSIYTVLFVVFFPLIHYLSSFTLDPTIDFFVPLSSGVEFSMPLYGAFLIALLLIGGMMMYLSARTMGAKYSLRSLLPLILLFLGFFPVAVTVPEYSMLMVLFGVVAFLAIVVQMRVKGEVKA
ncbi:hypothetical protein H3C67_04000 [Candidatus Dojkabacteria bacterium]|uniref:Uncharacterized protein n=2 Tax=Candidatus Dojkabacteria TaxID=74243 RepID=A0A136KFG9_9BACT|nr:MAG: hypothetical protein UZ20_WS6002000998 [candidate division WS6 bacterium OLB21]MBW7953926.1 hypothetical protein [Candidatus Dojkabacteria bacterium]